MYKTLKSWAVAAGLASLMGCHQSVAGVMGEPDTDLPSAVLTPTSLYHVNTAPGWDPEDPIPEPLFTGEALYCLRMDTPLGGGKGMGSEHFGAYVDLTVSDADGLEEVGMRFDSGSERYVMGSLSGAASLQYVVMRRNLPSPHGLNPVVYARDSLKNESSVAMNEVDCETLDALLEH